MKEKKYKIIQIISHNEELLGLDEQGNIFKIENETANKELHKHGRPDEFVFKKLDIKK